MNVVEEFIQTFSSASYSREVTAIGHAISETERWWTFQQAVSW
jgi:hypothetical protein